MMTSETCSGSIPAYKTYTQKGYYDPPFRISGLSGAIEQTGKYPWAIPADYPYAQWVAPVKIRSKPELKSDLVIGDIDKKRVYKILATAREHFPDWKSMKGGDFESYYALIGDAVTGEQVGWAILMEGYKTSSTDETGVIMNFGIRLASDVPLNDEQFKTYGTQLLEAKGVYDKLKAKPASSDQSATKIPEPPPVAKKSSGGMGVALLVALAAGVGTYFLAKKGA
jgi:hypothetical protein